MINLFDNVEEFLPQIEFNVSVRKGDKIFVLKSRNGAPSFQEFKVQNGSSTTTTFSAKDTMGKSWTIYRKGNPEDTYFKMDKEAVIATLTVIKKNVDTLLEYHTKYANEEEFVADKIEQLLSADGVAAKAQILRELKKSNYL